MQMAQTDLSHPWKIAFYKRADASVNSRFIFFLVIQNKQFVKYGF